ncbi:MAG: hypothetical protein RIS70_3595 [Planctomycetota bacterium]
MMSRTKRFFCSFACLPKSPRSRNGRRVRSKIKSRIEFAYNLRRRTGEYHHKQPASLKLHLAVGCHGGWARIQFLLNPICADSSRPIGFFEYLRKHSEHRSNVRR